MELTQKAIRISNEAQESVLTAQKTYQRARELIREALAVEYPLNSLVGKDYIYTRAMWGEPNKGITDETYLKQHAHMQAYQLEFGSNPDSNMGFEPGAVYACYVVLEEDSTWASEHPEFWELLFIKIN